MSAALAFYKLDICFAFNLIHCTQRLRSNKINNIYCIVIDIFKLL